MFWISDLDFVRGETRTRELPDRGDVIVRGCGVKLLVAPGALAGVWGVDRATAGFLLKITRLYIYKEGICGKA